MNARPPLLSLPAAALTIATTAILWLLVGGTFGDANPYATSYEARIGLYRTKLDSLNKIRGWRERIYMRNMANLEIPEYLVGKLRVNDTLLLPPRGYAKKYMATDVTWTDPRIFTWMVGFHNVVSWNDTNRRKRANAFVVLEANTIWITRPGGSTNIDSLFREYERSN